MHIILNLKNYSIQFYNYKVSSTVFTQCFHLGVIHKQRLLIGKGGRVQKLPILLSKSPLRVKERDQEIQIMSRRRLWIAPQCFQISKKYLTIIHNFFLRFYSQVLVQNRKLEKIHRSFSMNCVCSYKLIFMNILSINPQNAFLSILSC